MVGLVDTEVMEEHHPKTLEPVLPPENPLRTFPYWDSPEGKNLNSMACLEWLVAYLEMMETELSCEENKETLWHVRRALKCQRDRMRRRKMQGVLGTSKPHKITDLDPLPDIA
jgi:hypothetical protein